MDPSDRHFPLAAGILFGLGLGGMFDGIVLHQVLQWHHMVSTWYPVTSMESLELNTFWDGIFHSATYLLVVAGLFVLWRSAQRRHLHWPSKLIGGSLLIGFGSFNVVEGLVDHQFLGMHHVNETVAHKFWLYWDVGFLGWGALMLFAGIYLVRLGQRETTTTDREQSL